MPDKTNDVVDPKLYNEAIEKVNSEKMKREKAEEKVKEMQEKEEARKAKFAEKKKMKEEDKWKKESEAKDKRIKELEEAQKGKPKIDDTPNPKGVVQPTPAETNKPTEMLDERYGKDFKSSKDMSPIQRLIHYKTPTTQKYSSEKLGELLSLQASAQANDRDSLPQKFHDAQRNNIVGNEIVLPKIPK